MLLQEQEEEQADEENQEEAHQGIDQPLAQLDQVIEQRHWLVVFGSVVRLGQGLRRSMAGALCRPLRPNSKR